MVIKSTTVSSISNRIRDWNAVLFVFFVVSLGCTTGCNSILGSDDLSKYEWTKEKQVEEKNNVETKRGIIVSPQSNNVLQIRFATRSYDKKTMKKDLYKYEGKRYYYAEPDYDKLLQYLILWPLWAPIDLLAFPWDDKHSDAYKGENPPNFFYRFAYFPVIRLFFQPVLNSPYGYFGEIPLNSAVKWEGFFVRSIGGKATVRHPKTTESYGSGSKVKTVYQDYFTPTFHADNSGKVTVSGGGKSITYQTDANGFISVGLDTFLPAAFTTPTITLKIRHENWKQEWIIEVPVFTNPDSIDSWNIFINEQYDYRSRAFALGRLKPNMDKETYKKYSQLFIDGKINSGNTPAMTHTITVTPK